MQQGFKLFDREIASANARQILISVVVEYLCLSGKNLVCSKIRENMAN